MMIYQAFILAICLGFNFGTNIEDFNNINRSISSEKSVLEINDDKIRESISKMNVSSQPIELSNTFIADQDDEFNELKKTTLRGEIKVSREDIKEISKFIFKIGQHISEEYSLSDGLSMAMYVLRYFAQIGEYDLPLKDLKILLDNFERLTDGQLDPEIKMIIEQINYLRFGKKNGKYFVQFFSKRPQDCIIVNINKTIDDVSEIREITKLVLREGSKIIFKQSKNNFSDKSQLRYLKRKKVLGIYQVHHDILENVQSYYKEKQYPSRPLSLRFKGISLLISTNTILKDVELSLNKGLSLPGIKAKDGSSAPSLILDANAGPSDLFVSVKISIDL